MSELGSFEQINKVYTERNACVGMALVMAKKLGYRIGIKTEDPEWPIIFIDLPTGQVSWHIAKNDLIGYFPDRIVEYQGDYDGHNFTEKYGRLVEYAQAKPSCNFCDDPLHEHCAKCGSGCCLGHGTWLTPEIKPGIQQNVFFCDRCLSEDEPTHDDELADIAAGYLEFN